MDVSIHRCQCTPMSVYHCVTDIISVPVNTDAVDISVPVTSVSVVTDTDMDTALMSSVFTERHCQ